ncbi:MAG: hypothetical protein ACI9XR_001822 [Flavobacterium sp.]|jgi:hypothetical protein
MTKKIILLAFVISLVACKNEKTTPKVRYESTSAKMISAEDTTKIFIAELPINFDETNFFIFPIGELYSNANPKSTLDRGNFTISNYNEYEITGYLSNLKFQNIGSDSLHSLTDKVVMIERATYLKSLYDRTKKSKMVYVLADMDSNKDGKIDTNDIKSLYLSGSNGDDFVKVSLNLQELIDWTVIDLQNRLYFRTIEDINKNGAFDKDDRMHYYYADLMQVKPSPLEYFPVKNATN